MLLAGVLAASALWAAQPVLATHPDLWLEAELEPKQVYVQAQAIYRLRFYQAVDVRDLQITGPSARLADLRPLGPERIYEASRDGRRLRVRERSYAVFPFSSGPLELSGAYALARAPAVAGGAAASTDRRQALRLQAPVQTLTALPVPAAAAGAPWLPARSLTLNENWSTPDTDVQPGQALRRSIRIEALGIDAGQIPPLQITAPGMLVEAEAPRLENLIKGELNIGVREQSFRLVALNGGDILVPVLQLPWWNLATDTLAVATLPARVLRVALADAAPTSLRPVAATAAPLPEPASTPAPLPQTARLPPPTPSPWLLAAAVVLAAGLALAYLRHPGVRAAWRLRRACSRGDPGAVRDGLLLWAATLWPQTPPLTLEALAQRLPDPATRQALAALDRCLYGPQPARYDAAVLAATVRAVKGARPTRD